MQARWSHQRHCHVSNHEVAVRSTWVIHNVRCQKYHATSKITYYNKGGKNQQLPSFV